MDSVCGRAEDDCDGFHCPLVVLKVKYGLLLLKTGGLRFSAALGLFSIFPEKSLWLQCH